MFQLIAAREIDSVRIGRVRRIPSDALISYIRRLHPEQAVIAEDPGRGRLSRYSVQEAADLLGISRAFTYHLIASGEIGSFKIGKRREIPHNVLIGYIERLRSEQCGGPQHVRMVPPISQHDGRQDRS